MPLYRSSTHSGGTGLTTSASQTGLQRSSSGHKTYAQLRRSASLASGFGRGGPYTKFGTFTPPYHTVHPSAPHYMDRYPYVRYTPASNYLQSVHLINEGYQQSRQHYAQSYRDMKPYLEGKWSLYDTSLRVGPSYGPRYNTGGLVGARVATPRVHRDLNVDDAVRMYKNRCMTTLSLSKYWLSPSTWNTRRSYERNMSGNIASGRYSYQARYAPR